MLCPAVGVGKHMDGCSPLPPWGASGPVAGTILSHPLRSTSHVARGRRDGRFWRVRRGWLVTVTPALAVLVSVVLAACGGAGTTGTSQTGSTSPRTTLTTAARVTQTTGPVPSTVPLHVPDQQAARNDVALLNCNAEVGGWSAGGTVKNPTAQQASYLITIFFTSALATDLASGTTTVVLGPGQGNLWSVSAQFAAPAGVRCVLRGVVRH